MPDTKPLAADFSGFRDLPEETVEQVGAKAKRFESLRKGQDFLRTQTACDLYVAAFLLPKTGGAPTDPSKRSVPTTEELWLALNQGKIRPAMEAAPAAARRARAFHWPLEFPDVMQRGGFDVVLGNPPWERIKLQEQEFFASRAPEIVEAKNKAERSTRIKWLSEGSLRYHLSKFQTPPPPDNNEVQLFQEFEFEKRSAEATSGFVRLPDNERGRFPFTGTGDVNTYALFSELFSQLIIDQGSSGLIVPLGIATNETTSPFFANLVEKKLISSLYAFSEIKAWFAGTKDNQSFCLLTLAKSDIADFSFRINQWEDLQNPDRCFKLSPKEIQFINPNTRTAPVFRSRADAELTAKLYANTSVLINDTEAKYGNPWNITFTRLFDMSNDSEVFRTAEQLAASSWERNGLFWSKDGDYYVPLYEAKMVNFYDHRWGYYPDGEIDDTRALPRPSVDEKCDPHYEVSPRYWVPKQNLDSRLDNKSWSREWIFGWRDISNTTNERTLICGIIPRAGAGHKFLVMMPNWDTAHSCGLIANLGSLTADYISRQKLGSTSLNYFTMKQIAVLPPAFYTTPRLDFIVPRVLELTYTSHSLAPFARDLGYDGPPFAWDEDRRALLRADLDAFYARAYGLDRDELRYILDPADVKGPDYPSETFRVLKEKEIRQHGEYRTRRLVLEAWDRMEAEGEFTRLGL
jgi:hypothetical protein